MRILIVSDVAGAMPGGVPAETRVLISGLADMGHSLAYAGDVPVVAAEVAAHFPISLPIGASFSQQVNFALNRFSPDFIHVICMSSRGVVELARLLRRRRWALTVHSVSPYERKLGLFHSRESLHYGLRSVRFLPNSLAWRAVLSGDKIPRVVVHSEFVAQVVERYGFPPAKIRLITLPFRPVPLDRSGGVRSSAGELLLATVGGFAHTKGQHDVIKALPVVARRFPRVRYRLIGEVRDPLYASWLSRLAARLGVAERVSFSVGLDGSDVVTELSKVDVYVQPSHEEGFCISYAEAAALVPRLVGTRTGAIAAMSRDDPGARVVAVRDPAALADAIGTLASIELPVDHMARRVARLSSAFSYAGYLSAHEAIYAE